MMATMIPIITTTMMTVTSGGDDDDDDTGMRECSRADMTTMMTVTGGGGDGDDDDAGMRECNMSRAVNTHEYAPEESVVLFKRAWVFGDLKHGQRQQVGVLECACDVVDSDSKNFPFTKVQRNAVMSRSRSSKEIRGREFGIPNDVRANDSGASSPVSNRR